jgi:hypothetical protein
MFFVIIYLARSENNNPCASAPSHLANNFASGVDLNEIMCSRLALASRGNYTLKFSIKMMILRQMATPPEFIASPRHPPRPMPDFRVARAIAQSITRV